jgi:hypothetical protein
MPRVVDEKPMRHIARTSSVTQKPVNDAFSPTKEKRSLRKKQFDRTDNLPKQAADGPAFFVLR